MAEEAGRAHISSGTAKDQRVQDSAGCTGCDKVKTAEKMEKY